MTIAKAQKKFEELKRTVLEDGKIDIDEVKELIDFIEPYVRSNDEKFVKFGRLLKKCAEDNAISKDESYDIIVAMDIISKFLKVEAAVEYVFFGGLAIMTVLFVVAFYVSKFMN